MASVVIMERSDQAGAFQKVMRTAETEIDSFGASGSGPMHERLRAAYDFVPSRAPESRPRAMFRAGVERPLVERSRSDTPRGKWRISKTTGRG